MQILDDPRLCCGCSACSQICPQGCITMNKNSEGFLYPNINSLSCINCKLCIKACPIINQKVKNKKPLRIFAYHADNENIRMTSSSGGAFHYFATKIIEQNGFIMGAGFNEEWKVTHQEATSLKELENLKRSKYVQSDINNTYQRTQELLKKGEIVLFTGTPCQIAGLHSYLRKEYNNLYTIDLICHGVPSPDVFDAYSAEISNTKSCDINSNPLRFYKKNNKEGKKISYINFRTKKGNNLWRLYSLELNFQNSDTHIIHDWKHDIYSKGFLDNLYLRESCYQCQFRNLTSGADITIGDFWGIEKYLTSHDDNKGTNVIIINTQKGAQLCSDMTSIHEGNLQQIIEHNISLIKSPKPHTLRNFFFQNYKKKGMIFTTLVCIQRSKTAMLLRKYFNIKNKFL